MAIEHIFSLPERAVTPLCLFIGVVFLTISAYVWHDGGLQRNGDEFFILIPLLYAVVLVAGSLALRPDALRILVFLWFVVLPAILYVANLAACRAGWFSKAWCQ